MTDIFLAVVGCLATIAVMGTLICIFGTINADVGFVVALMCLCLFGFMMSKVIDEVF